MTMTYTLNLKGIQGESGVKNHENEIKVDEVIQEYDAPSEMDNLSDLEESDIRPAVICHGIRILKHYEKSTPNLLSALTEGKEIEEGSISCIGTDERVFLTIGLKRIVIRKVKLIFDHKKAGVEVHFSYGDISHSFTPEGAKKSIFGYSRDLP